MRFHHPSIPIVLTAMLIDSIGFDIVLPVLPDPLSSTIAFALNYLLMAAALAFGAEHGEPGGAFLLAATLVLLALLTVIFAVVRQLKPA